MKWSRLFRFPQVDIAAHADEVEFHPAPVEGKFDRSPAHAFHVIVLADGNVEIGVHIARNGFHFQVNGSRGRNRHIDIAADIRNGKGMLVQNGKL